MPNIKFSSLNIGEGSVVDLAIALGLPVSTYADPTSTARADVPYDEARGIESEDPTLVYVMVPLIMGDVLGDDDAVATVAAEVAGRDTVWSIVPAADGWQPAGDSIDCWVDRDLARIVDTDALLAIGREIVARAR